MLSLWSIVGWTIGLIGVGWVGIVYVYWCFIFPCIKDDPIVQKELNDVRVFIDQCWNSWEDWLFDQHWNPWTQWFLQLWGLAHKNIVAECIWFPYCRQNQSFDNLCICCSVGFMCLGPVRPPHSYKILSQEFLDKEHVSIFYYDLNGTPIDIIGLYIEIQTLYRKPYAYLLFKPLKYDQFEIDVMGVVIYKSENESPRDWDVINEQIKKLKN